MVKNSDLFNIDRIFLDDLFKKSVYPYEILPIINDYILEVGKRLSSEEYEKKGDNIWIHKSVKMDEGVEIMGPAIVMEGVTLRHNAFLRENVIVGPNSVVGNSCEIKNSILISNCEIPHFNYVGDSILGTKVHLGAGVILANLRFDKKNIKIDNIDTNLRKIGAFIGDNSEIGCNSVINPGTIILPNSLVFPLSNISGIYDGNKDIKVERL